MSTANSADIEAARVLLARLGVSASDLLAATQAQPLAPTFAEYIPVATAAVGPGTRRTYGSYWNRITEHWGTRRLNEPTPSEIQQLSETIKRDCPRCNRKTQNPGMKVVHHRSSSQGFCVHDECGIHRYAAGTRGDG